MEVMHFKSQKERLDYLKGNFKEIIPQKAETPVTDAPSAVEGEEKPKKKSSKKKEKKDDAVQAE